MSLQGYKKKGKPALWTQVAGAKTNQGVPIKFDISPKMRSKLRELHNKQPDKIYFLKRSSKPIPHRAARHRDADKEYKRIADAYKFSHRECECGCGRASEHIHHMRGNTGKLKTDPRYFMAVCFTCHRWIHDHPAEAKAKGWLGGAGEWDKVEE